MTGTRTSFETAPPTSRGEGVPPLAGVTVVSFEQAVSLPFCSRMLADMGARVVKVEARGTGDFTRHYDGVVKGMAAHFVWLNRNKKSLTLDLKHPRATGVLDRLLSRADVVLQNLAPGAAERLGISAASVNARYPRVVAADISGYGTGGPLDHKRAYDLLIQAEAGACSITGLPGSPAKSGPPMADLSTGMQTLAAVLAALFQRSTTGVGTVIDIAMFDVMAEWMGFALQYTMHTGIEREPLGMETPMVAPYGAFPTADGELVVLGTTNDAEWDRLARRVLGREDLAADARYASNELRCQHRDEIDLAIGDWTRGHTLDEVQEIADEAGIGNARYNTVQHVLDHRQLADRSRWGTVGSPVGPLVTLAPPFSVPAWPVRWERIPDIGEDTDALLADLGYSASEIGSLRSDGVV
ncbi:MAG TPA: CaiB/BaiF CoA-transferase family protein [Acidimicrobiales bacterium]|nr:CaiB/BaiF CoA-transferase family protein [Acidimicrobiales bacterium]